MIFECSYLCFGGELVHPLSTYETGGVEGETSKMYSGM